MATTKVVEFDNLVYDYEPVYMNLESNEELRNLTCLISCSELVVDNVSGFPDSAEILTQMAIIGETIQKLTEKTILDELVSILSPPPSYDTAPSTIEGKCSVDSTQSEMTWCNN
ncbi:hypothetical protein [Eastern grey kangaroopox virus]|uniref:Uncharacterized protein n=1 Tax=Eastern grey kangaroopox virus TaxID=2042482 RepID=A0A2C9DSZ5_9POXV|nr:hypothetical protein KM541_gp032 [Eastern grey kangaroopox virus]ATI21128.1 hypothetical protein [Eastern grey kangaroopox virus]ATX75026.1 hypothetical protein EKPV-NSW-ORF045 [Eastern grey kangaroopox virus]